MPHIALHALLLAGAPLARASTLGATPDIDWLRLALSLTLCLGIAVAAIYLVWRRQGLSPAILLARRNNPQAIDVKEMRRISLHADLCRFHCDGRAYLIVVTPHTATLLRERDLDNTVPLP